MMNVLLIGLLIGAGTAAWSYLQLAKRTGNAMPRNNVFSAVIIGFVVGIIVITILKFVLNI